MVHPNGIPNLSMDRGKDCRIFGHASRPSRQTRITSIFSEHHYPALLSFTDCWGFLWLFVAPAYAICCESFLYFLVKNIYDRVECTFFSMAYLAAAINCPNHRNYWKTALPVILGVFAGLAKVTTFLGYIPLVSAFLIAKLWSIWRKERDIQKFKFISYALDSLPEFLWGLLLLGFVLRTTSRKLTRLPPRISPLIVQTTTLGITEPGTRSYPVLFGEILLGASPSLLEFHNSPTFC